MKVVVLPVPDRETEYAFWRFRNNLKAAEALQQN
jgi:hypothetical protein